MNHSFDQNEPIPVPQEQSSAPPESIPSRLHRPLADILLAWGTLLFSYFLMEMREFRLHPSGVFLVFTCIAVLSAVYLRFSRVRITVRNCIPDILIFLLSCSLLTNGNAYVRGCVILLLFLSLPYRFFGFCGLTTGSVLSENVFTDILRSYLALPFHHIRDFFASLFGFIGKKANKFGKTVAWVLWGLLVALIPTSLVILLLSYDSHFIELLVKTFDFELDFGNIFSFILAIPCAFVWFGMLLTGKKLAAGEETQSEHVFSARFLPCVLLCAAVTPLLAVYLIFFISQMPYYLSAFTGVLPHDLSYADYARDGFFQLCTVSGINALLLLFFSVFMREGGKARDRAKRIFSSLLSLFTLVLILTALSKMALYISSYGLTQKRVYASWLMLLLGAVFIPVLLRQIFPKFRFTSVFVIVLLVFAAAITLPNVDGIIADYNVDSYLDGRLSEMDVEMMEADLRLSAVPAMVRLRDSLDSRPALTPEEQQILTQTQNALERMQSSVPERSFFNFSIPTLLAENALKK